MILNALNCRGVRMNRLARLAFTGALFLLASGWESTATSYFQDGINYTAGTQLGSNAPWAYPLGVITVSNGSLSYSNLTPVSPGGNMISVAANSALAYSSAPLNTAATSGNVYLSFLIKYNVFSGNTTRGGLLQSGNDTGTLTTSSDPLDLIDNTFTGGYKLGVRAKGGSTAYVTNAYSPLQLGTTYLVVMRYKFSDGSASMWVNPPIGGSEPATADATSVTGGGIVSDLSYVYFRAGTATPGYLVDNIQVGSTWQDVTGTASAQLGLLSFTAQPTTTVAGNILSNISVQLQDPVGNTLASNNVPVVLTLNGGTFAAGTSVTNNTSATGLASFSNLVINTSGAYTMNASATGFNPKTSATLTVNPAPINHYILTVSTNAALGQPFTLSGTGIDAYNNSVTNDNSSVVTLASSGNIIFDGNNNGSFAEPGDNILTLNSGSFSLNAKDLHAETATITVSDANGKTGTSASILISSNVITDQGYQLLSFLNCLRVDQYWIGGSSVNFLTGAAGGSGPNMTIGTATHCSAFGAAAAELLGVYMLRPPEHSDVDLANGQADWFVTNTDGWFPIPLALNAQHMADTGVLVVASFKSSSGSGHLAILRPTTRSDIDVNAFGPEECQSGANNYYSTNVMTGFNQHSGAFPNGIKYYGHTLTYPLTNPQPVINPGSVSNQVFRGTITSFAGRKYQIQWSSNLTTWSALSTFTNRNSPPSFYTNTPFSDSSLTTNPKFWRVLDQ